MRATYRGREVSSFAQEHGFVDLATFSQAFNKINVSSNILEIDPNLFENVECGQLYETEDGDPTDDGSRDDVHQRDIYQYFLVDENGFHDLKRIGEIVCWSDVLDNYVWCVTHFGTPWTGVLTDIPLESVC